ncbi:tyrosine-type recombinase/integrase [Bradyrhizobium sp. USDA 4503]
MLNTGARVQEILDLRLSDIRTDPPRQVRLHGKGGKTRLCPIWPQTARLLQELSNSAAHSEVRDAPLFVNRQGNKLTRFGVRYLLKHITAGARATRTLLGEAHPSAFLAAYKRHFSSCVRCLHLFQRLGIKHRPGPILLRGER